jgi:hypothetical protein
MFDVERSMFDVHLFDIWNFNQSMKLQQSKAPLGITKAGPSEPGYLVLESLLRKQFRLSPRVKEKDGPAGYFSLSDPG